MVTEDDVRDVYRAVLNRDPESEAAVARHRQAYPSLEALIRAFIGSEEYRLGHPMRTELDAMYDGINPGDEALLRRHLVQTEPEDGFVKNFVGTRMRVSHADQFAGLSGLCYNEIPTRLLDYHAEAIEFIGTLRAIEAGAGPFIGVELGAGWGSWTVTSGHVARTMGRSPIRLYAVEASAGKAANIRINFADNGFDPDQQTIVNAIVGAADGYALFPITDVTGEWGSSALFTDSDADRPGYERIRSISIATLLKDEKLVDFVHFDIQGAEAEAIAAGIDTLTAKVRYMVVGTHGRSIEGKIIEMLRARGWVLENEQPARIRQLPGGSEVVQADGTQVWWNPAIPVLGTH